MRDQVSYAIAPAAGSENPMDSLFHRELAEVYLLIDHISSRVDKRLPSQIDVGGDGPVDSVDWMTEICELTWPPQGSTKEIAQQAVFLIKARDALNHLAAPATGASIAFTIMTVDADAPPTRRWRRSADPRGYGHRPNDPVAYTGPASKPGLPMGKAFPADVLVTVSALPADQTANPLPRYTFVAADTSQPMAPSDVEWRRRRRQHWPKPLANRELLPWQGRGTSSIFGVRRRREEATPSHCAAGRRPIDQLDAKGRHPPRNGM